MLWVSKFLGKEYSAHFISPFNANESVLQVSSFLDKSSMQDATTLFELEVFAKLKASSAYNERFVKPQMIGPDRRTVQHTVNTIDSYGPSLPTEKRAVRPDYRDFIDVLGTQARYPDESASKVNYDYLRSGQTMGVWCTLCSQEWDRTLNQKLIQQGTAS